MATPEKRKQRSDAAYEFNSRPSTREKHALRRADPNFQLKHREAVKAALQDRLKSGRWANNGKISRRLKADEALPEGWMYGMKPREK